MAGDQEWNMERIDVEEVNSAFAIVFISLNSDYLTYRQYYSNVIMP